MPTPKPKPTQLQRDTIKLLHKKAKLGVYQIQAIAEVARIKQTEADFNRYIKMLNCYLLFARLEMTSSEQTSLIRECGGSELWAMSKDRVARLHEKLTVRLADTIHHEKRQGKKYAVHTLKMDSVEDMDDLKLALDTAGRYGEPGTVKAVFENGNLIRMYANGVPLEVRIMDMSY